MAPGILTDEQKGQLLHFLGVITGDEIYRPKNKL